MICAIIQARMSSSRLPGKVLLEVNGRPLLSYMLERVSAAKSIHKVILATSIDQADDAVAAFCENEDILCYRGSLDDVLDRYYQAALMVGCETVVRLTGDCPLIDPEVIDTVVQRHCSGGYDYTANTSPPEGITFPEGMDVEVFSFQALKRAWNEAKKPSDREHVTFYIVNNPRLFSVFRYDREEDFSRYRLTVDYPEDFGVVKDILTKIYSKNPKFSMKDIIAFLDAHQDIRRKNADILSFQGWQSAFEKDKQAGYVIEK